MIELSDNNSNKQIQSHSLDPITIIMKQLKDTKCKEGDYVKIINKSI